MTTLGRQQWNTVENKSREYLNLCFHVGLYLKPFRSDSVFPNANMKRESGGCGVCQEKCRNAMRCLNLMLYTYARRRRRRTHDRNEPAYEVLWHIRYLHRDDTKMSSNSPSRRNVGAGVWSGGRKLRDLINGLSGEMRGFGRPSANNNASRINNWFRPVALPCRVHCA